MIAGGCGKCHARTNVANAVLNALHRDAKPHLLCILARGSAQTPSERVGRPIPTDIEELTMRCLQVDPQQRYQNAEAFAALVPGLLKADPGLNKESTMQAMVAATASVPADDLKQSSGKSFRVGDFVFDLGEQGWRFTMAFYDADQ